jgi:hypothetical protein
MPIGYWLLGIGDSRAARSAEFIPQISLARLQTAK